MSEIQSLPQQVIDQIAAGEVVERPSHLVKEIIENSIDAGATELHLDISKGGRSLSLKDNGTGIEKDQLHLALARHATSKLKKYSDIWSLNSFGFRGEALASIAAVSQLRLVSKTKQSEKAYQISSEFGELGELSAAGGAQGTELYIEKLFANVPARLKFLKSDGAEVTQIKNTVKALGLAHPNVSFTVRLNGKLLWTWPKEKKQERAQRVLEVRSLYHAQQEHAGIQVQALVSSPSEVLKSRRGLWVFVQNRWVQDKSVIAAVLDAYRSLLMHGEYPQGCFWLEVPSDEVDVNIHPTKSQVKFLNSSEVYRAVQRAVRKTLEEAPWLEAGGVKPVEAKSLKTNRSQKPVLNQAFDDEAFKQTQYSQKKQGSFIPQNEEAISLNLGQLESVSLRASTSENLSDSSQELSASEKNTELDNYLSDQVEVYQSTTPTPIENQQKEDLFQNKDLASVKKYWGSLQVLTQVNQTYLVCQSEKQLVLVDQHAAHERVLYETLYSSWEEQKMDVQNFLLPLSIELEEEEVTALLRQKDKFESLGFGVEKHSSRQVDIRWAPAFVNEKSCVEVVRKVAQESSEKGGSFALEKIVGDLIATMACHSAIRAGQALSVEQIKSLLQDMDQFPFSSYCPHGRPVAIDFTWAELEKLFGRTV